MAVSPLPRQSTMPLLQVHMAGQEPEDKLQSWACAESVCPLGKQPAWELKRAGPGGWVAAPQGMDPGDSSECWDSS